MTNATGGVPTGNTFDKYAAANPVERRMMQGFFGALDGFVRAAAPSRVVEVGAGEGEVATRVRELCPDAAISLLDLPDPELMAHWAPAGHSGTAGSQPWLQSRLQRPLRAQSSTNGSVTGHCRCSMRPTWSARLPLN